ncbi:9956_t:CDS:2, partial [Acaulospora colombiana]
VTLPGRAARVASSVVAALWAFLTKHLSIPSHTAMLLAPEPGPQFGDSSGEGGGAGSASVSRRGSTSNLAKMDGKKAVKSVVVGPDGLPPPKKKRRRQALSCTGACVIDSSRSFLLCFYNPTHSYCESLDLVSATRSTNAVHLRYSAAFTGNRTRCYDAKNHPANRMDGDLPSSYGYNGMQEAENSV